MLDTAESLAFYIFIDCVHAYCQFPLSRLMILFVRDGTGVAPNSRISLFPNLTPFFTFRSGFWPELDPLPASAASAVVLLILL